jgi:hypothetical protein
MCDLFCGRGGWTKGFQAHGWHCVGIDLFPQPDYPGEFIQADVAHLLELPPADFYCCSSPCEQFSVHGMKHFHPNPKWPWLGIALFERAKELIEATGKPYVMENVRAAQKFIGTAAQKTGPFYLWGTGIPAILPQGFIKGMTRKAHGFREYKGEPGWNKRQGMETRNDRRAAAKAAEIPQELASHIAQTAGALCR